MVATRERPSREASTRTNDDDTTHDNNQHDNDTPKQPPLRINIDDELDQLKTIGDEREKYRGLCDLFSRVKAFEREQEEEDAERHSYDPTQNLETVFDDEPDQQRTNTDVDEQHASRPSTSWADAVRKPRLTHAQPAQPAQNVKRHMDTPQVDQHQPTHDDDDDDSSRYGQSTCETRARAYSPFAPRGINAHE